MNGAGSGVGRSPSSIIKDLERQLKDLKSEIASLQKTYVSDRPREYLFCPKCRYHLCTSYYDPCPHCGEDLSAYTIKRGRDYGEPLTIGDLISGMADRIDQALADCDDDMAAVADFLDKEFLYGAWSHLVGKDPLFGKDLRGALIAAYKEGLKRS